MKPYNPGGHSACQDRVLAQLRKYYPDAVSSLPDSTWAVMEKFWNLDLSGMDSLMADHYSDFGPAPRLPSDMLRSILLSVEFKVTSYTRWAADLKENHLHAILSGFPVGDTSGVGMEAGRPIVRYSERLYKTGQWKAVSPRGLRKKYQDHTRYRRGPVYLLCSGAYVAGDFRIVGAHHHHLNSAV